MFAYINNYVYICRMINKKVIAVRFSEEEYEYLKDGASKCNIKLSSYIRMKLLYGFNRNKDGENEKQ